MSARWIGLMATVVLFTANPLGAKERRERSPSWAITGAKIDRAFTDKSQKVTVVVTQGVISCVAANCAIPKGARVVSGEGWTLTPGMVETAAHIGLMEVALEKSSHDGYVTGVDNAADVMARDGISMNSRVVRAAVRGGVTRAVSAPRAAALVAGQSVAIWTASADITAAIEMPSVALHVRVGEGAKRHARRALIGARSGQFATLRTLFEAATSKRRGSAPWTLGDRSTAVALKALDGALAGKQLVAIHAHRASDIAAALRLVARYRLKAVIVGGAEAHVLAKQIKGAGVAVVLTPSRANRFATLRARPDAAALLHRAGVRVVLASADTFGARNLRWVAGLAVRRGLPRGVALRAITTEAAAVWGLARGELRVGQRANIVAFSGDPLGLDGHVRFVGSGQDLIHQPTQR